MKGYHLSFAPRCRALHGGLYSDKHEETLRFFLKLFAEKAGFSQVKQVAHAIKMFYEGVSIDLLPTKALPEGNGISSAEYYSPRPYERHGL